MKDEYLHDVKTVLTEKEIEELRDLCYEYGNSWFPISDFFNDIRDNKEPGFNKNQAYKDLWLIVNTVLEKFEKSEKIKRIEEKLGLARLKNVDFAIIRFAKSVDEYNMNIGYDLTANRTLTNEEFLLLKEEN